MFIPDNFEPCSNGIIILTPDDTSAQSFIEGARGQNWLDIANTNGIALIVVEPYEAGAWNLDNAITMRDDDAFLKNIYDTIRDKREIITAAFDLDERGLYLIGYDQGGSAAHKMAMLWPQLICGLASINGGDVPEEIITYYSGKRAFPFALSIVSDGKETLSLPTGEIPVPVWMFVSPDASENSETTKNHWITAAKAVECAPNEYAQQVYENGPIRIWVTEGEVLPEEIIYNEFLVRVQRLASEPGGVLHWTVKDENQDGTGFFFTETEVDGRIRRWLTYVPSSYDGSKAYPLVVGLHGGSNQGIAFAADSKWHEAAEKYGFLVVYPTAFPTPILGNIPFPSWHQYVIAAEDAPDDVAFIKEVIQRIRQDYNVDTGRIYATGHSNGSGMAWRLGLDAPEVFAAIAPAGLTIGAVPIQFDAQSFPQPQKEETAFNVKDILPIEVPLPVWVYMGRYDWNDADAFVPGNWNDLCLNYWSERNGFNPTVLTTRYDGTGRYYIRTWTNGSGEVPIFNYITVQNCPHIYVPYACDLVWQEFFSKLSIDADGKRYYDGQEIVRA